MMAASHPQAPPVLNTTPYHAIAIPEAPDATPKAQHLWRVAALLAAGGAVLLLTIGRLGAPEVAAFGHAGLTAPATSTTAAAAPAPTMARPMGHPPRATPQPLPAQPQAVASASGPTLGRAPATPAASGPSSRWLWALAAPLAAVACLWAAFDRRQRLGDRIALAAVTGRRAVYHVTKALPEDSSGGERAPLKSDGAGKSFASPTWVTEFFKALRGDDGSGIPVADAKLEDVTDLLGGALFLPLFKWMQESGPIYRLAAGPQNFVIISEPEAAQHVLKKYGTLYAKGLVRELSVFLFGVFAPAALKLNGTLEKEANSGKSIDMEDLMSKLTLDVIGKSVFDYDFDSLTNETSVIQSVYTALKEVEQRATDVLPYWKVPFLRLIDPRQRKAAAAVQEIRDVTDELIAKCKAIVEAENNSTFAEEEEYVNADDPSLLRFLLESREEVTETQLRDDLLSMLVAGHETTGSVLTWTLYLLSQNPDKLALAQEELDRVLGDRVPTYEDFANLRYLTRCVNESMRLYPHPPVLIRRTKGPDTLPGPGNGYPLGPNQDVMISVYNIHRSPDVWGPDAGEFKPERFGPLDGPIPNEANTNYRYIPFGGGPRKCVGDQFAMLEAIIALAVVLKKYEFDLDTSKPLGMTTGATIHTTEGLYMRVRTRAAAGVPEPAVA